MRAEYKTIAARARLGLPLDERERAVFLLFIATAEEVEEYQNTKGVCKPISNVI